MCDGQAKRWCVRVGQRTIYKVKHKRTADMVVAGFRTHKDGAGPTGRRGAASRWNPMPATGSTPSSNTAHELGVARSESARARIQATRADAERRPDPSVGVHMANDRGGEEHIVGLTLSIPLPGEGRRADADMAVASAQASAHRETGVLRRVNRSSNKSSRAQAFRRRGERGDGVEQRVEMRDHEIGRKGLDRQISVTEIDRRHRDPGVARRGDVSLPDRPPSRNGPASTPARSMQNSSARASGLGMLLRPSLIFAVSCIKPPTP